MTIKKTKGIRTDNPTVFGIVESVLEEELGGSVTAEAKAAWKNAVRGLVAGVAKKLK